MVGNIIRLNGTPSGETQTGIIQIVFEKASRQAKATFTPNDGSPAKNIPVQKDDCYIWPYIEAKVEITNGDAGTQQVNGPLFIDGSLQTAKMNFQPQDMGYKLIKSGTPDEAVVYETDKAGYHEIATYIRDLNNDDKLDWVQYSSHVQEGHDLIGLASVTFVAK